VKKIERSKTVGTAEIVLPTLTATEKDAAVSADRWLTDLNVEMFGAQGDFAGNGDTSMIGAQIVTPGWKAKGSSQLAELTSGVIVEFALGLIVIGDGLAEIEVHRRRCAGHGCLLETQRARRVAGLFARG
jgi:hypothetical protein